MNTLTDTLHGFDMGTLAPDLSAWIPGFATGEAQDSPEDAITSGESEATRARTNTRTSDSTDAAKIESLATAAVDEIEEYRTFAQGWDGYFAPSFDPQMLEAAKKVVRYIEIWFKKSNIVPNEITPGPAPDGSIDIEVLKDSNRLIVTLEFFEDEFQIRAYSETERGQSEEPLKPSLSAIGGKFAEVFG